MNAKKLKVLLIAVLVVVAALSINVVCFAAPDEGDFVINTLPDNTDSLEDTEEETIITTKKPTTTKNPTTTKKPTTANNGGGGSSSVVVTTEPTEEYKFKIKLELNNGEEAVEIGVDNDGFVEIPEAPKKDGFKFDGWYSDEGLTEKWDFLTSVADEDTILYAKWEAIQDDELYQITVSTNLGGVITVTPTRAKPGEIVTIEVSPDEGFRLVENSLSVNGKFIDGMTFEMPANKVVVEAQFESIAAEKEESEAKGLTENIGKIITIAAIAIIVIAIVIWLIINRYRFLPEPEEDELFFVEPMTNQPAIRHDDFIRSRQNKVAGPSDDDIDIINEAEIRKINKTGNINLDQ